MNDRPDVGDELCLMSGHFVAAASFHLENARKAETARDSLDQSRHALSSIICSACALESVVSEAKALHRLDNSNDVSAPVLALKPSKAVVGLLKYVPAGLQPGVADATLLNACAAYYLRNKFVHYGAVWAREWPQHLVDLGVDWDCRNPLHSPAPGNPEVRPFFPDDVLCSEGSEWAFTSCMQFLAWWAGAVGKEPWWAGRTVPSRILVARLRAPQR